MKSKHALTLIILDKSGSMDEIKTDTVGSVNTYIEQQKKLPGTCEFALVQFNSEVSDIKLQDIQNVTPISNDDYIPSGLTALNDAIGITVENLGKILNERNESERPELVTICIITDGEENSSRKFKLNDVKEMVKHQTDAYKWNFLFLGADIDSFANGSARGISISNTSNYIKSPIGTKAAFAAASYATSCLRTGGDINDINMSALYNSCLETEDLKDQMAKRIS